MFDRGIRGGRLGVNECSEWERGVWASRPVGPVGECGRSGVVGDVEHALEAGGWQGSSPLTVCPDEGEDGEGAVDEAHTGTKRGDGVRDRE